LKPLKEQEQIDESQDKKIGYEASFLSKFLQLLLLVIISSNVYLINVDIFDYFGFNDNVNIISESFDFILLNILISGLLISFIHVISFLLIGSDRSMGRRLSVWYKIILEKTVSLPLIKGFINYLITFSKKGDQSNVEDDMNATLQESLDYLEEAVIPEESEELRMIRGVLRMDSVKVREIMVPRVDILSISAESTIAQVADLMKAEGGHSKIPVFGDSIDDIVGIAYARDILSALDENVSPQSTVRNLVRKSLHVPESQSLEKFLREIQEQSTSVAMVVDEYGGISGLITVTDLIEEIVGELTDEFDKFIPEIEKINDFEVLADAGVSIDSLNQTLGTSIEANGFDTVGGLVMKFSGRIPEINDEISIGDIIIKVTSVKGRRLEKVKIIINQ
jgi:CBS domain containing-hemolysin-like protein